VTEYESCQHLSQAWRSCWAFARIHFQAYSHWLCAQVSHLPHDRSHMCNHATPASCVARCSIGCAAEQEATWTSELLVAPSSAK
jgi:hypothetical protein